MVSQISPLKYERAMKFTARCNLLAGFLFFLDLNDFPAFVETAVRADGVGKALGSAIGTNREVGSRQRVL